MPVPEATVDEDYFAVAGEHYIRGARELRHKECDRIAAMAAGLRALGAEVEEREDGWILRGPCDLRGAEVDSFGDHRIAMALAVAALGAAGESQLDDPDCVGVSFPGFFELLDRARQA